MTTINKPNQDITLLEQPAQYWHLIGRKDPVQVAQSSVPVSRSKLLQFHGFTKRMDAYLDIHCLVKDTDASLYIKYAIKGVWYQLPLEIAKERGITA